MERLVAIPGSAVSRDFHCSIDTPDTRMGGHPVLPQEVARPMLGKIQDLLGLIHGRLIVYQIRDGQWFPLTRSGWHGGTSARIGWFYDYKIGNRGQRPLPPINGAAGCSRLTRNCQRQGLSNKLRPLRV